MIELIGYAAAILAPCTMLPQIIKSFRTQKVEDVSTGMLTLYIVSAGLWIAYGISINSIPLIIADSFAFCAGLTQFFIKLKYQKS